MWAPGVAVELVMLFFASWGVERLMRFLGASKERKSHERPYPQRTPLFVTSQLNCLDLILSGPSDHFAFAVNDRQEFMRFGCTTPYVVQDKMIEHTEITRRTVTLNARLQSDPLNPRLPSESP